jgi:hypothetical protein
LCSSSHCTNFMALDMCNWSWTWFIITTWDAWTLLNLPWNFTCM